ncbi:MAG TPA: tetratricopeptide repeat protein [Gemmatimonadaceae bacterium]|nr:tetratricopeptide repeat protein [Gemmatimonadaceae bacterium]
MDIEAALKEAMSLGEEGRFDEMAQVLADALADEPDEPYLLGWLGVAERELGNDGAAYEYFKRCVAAEPVDPQLLALAGAGLAAFDDPEAEPTLRAAALTGPDLAVTRLQYGAYLAREGMFIEALEQLDAAAQIDPEDPVIHGELGIAHALKGDMDAAARAMEQALTLAEDDSWTRLLLGLVQAEQDRIDDAAESMLRAAEERPHDAEAQLLAALAACAAGWDDAAQSALARAEFAEEGLDTALQVEVEERLVAGADAARTYLRDTIGPSTLHDRLTQPL